MYDTHQRCLKVDINDIETELRHEKTPNLTTKHKYHKSNRTLLSPKSNPKSIDSKLSDFQVQNLAAQAAKMKEMFLKEYEELITEKNNEINSLNAQIRDLKSHNKQLVTDVKDYLRRIKDMEEEIKQK